MLSSHYIEDIFLSFYQLMIQHGFALAKQDAGAAYNFQNLIATGDQLTKNQANLIIKILQKYKVVAQRYNLVYENELNDPQWKNSFRVLDLTKRIYLETDSLGEVWVILKFPYHLKEIFDKEFPPRSGYGVVASWDPDRKIRKVRFYDVNIIALHEFAKLHQFEIDNSFLEATEIVENYWNEEDSFLSYSVIHNNKIVLVNSNESVDEFYKEHATGDLEHDMFLAKSMNFPLKDLKNPQKIVEKIAVTEDNIFWINTYEKFFELYKSVNEKICLVLDRNTNTKSWLKEFITETEKFGISRRDFRVCFRAPKEDTSGLNQWIKDSDLGGPIADGRFFIFLHKPAKWLFKDKVDVKIIVTNSLYPDTSGLMKDWINSHPCVVYLGETKPTPAKGSKIVNL
jgi:hypothetical protein